MVEGYLKDKVFKISINVVNCHTHLSSRTFYAEICILLNKTNLF